MSKNVIGVDMGIKDYHLKQVSNTSIKINRFELISDSGREKTIYCKDMYFQIQDSGSTIKVFYQDKNVCKNGEEISKLIGDK